MPAFVGAINVVSIGSSGVMNIGDVYLIAPNSSAKTFAGAGSFNTGDNMRVYNHYSNTNTFDADYIDQPQTANN
ncbi:spore germination protein [Calidifontibacillus oryziterrae]|uniref:spore germination protein n=1 Tax=Calidifontibacillus oryziterrae TaxID=1191699 RepID=UPI00030E8FD0|nr:spore germination protein [Calidifontibacillus oryziterrae]